MKLKKYIFLLVLLTALIAFSSCSSEDPFGPKDTTTTTTTDSNSSDGNTTTTDNNNDGNDSGDSDSDGNDSDGGDDGGSNSTGTSTSHNFGNNCVSCHTSGGSGSGVFTVAGSVYNSSGTAKTAGTISVYVYPQSGLTGTPVIIPVDASGNFYSTTTMTLGSTKIVNSTGIEKTMPSTTPTKGCTSCHSTSGSQNKLMLD